MVCLLAKLIFPLALLALRTDGKVVVDYDHKLPSGEVEYVVVEPVVIQPLGESHVKGRAQEDVLGRDRRPLLTPRDVLDELLGKRQTCAPGFGYCSVSGRCCPTNTNCCTSGHCAETGQTCCRNGVCDVGENCCGPNNCHPRGSQCCRDGSWCERGNVCVIWGEQERMVCCTDLQCTAHVSDGSTISSTRFTSTTTTRTTTFTNTYYWTVTWYYYYYYWTYSARIEASIVTSSRETQYTTYTLTTTDAAAASSYFSDVSRTLTLPTPAAATSLESLAGSTSFRTSATLPTAELPPRPPPSPPPSPPPRPPPPPPPAPSDADEDPSTNDPDGDEVPGFHDVIEGTNTTAGDDSTPTTSTTSTLAFDPVDEPTASEVGGVDDFGNGDSGAVSLKPGWALDSPSLAFLTVGLGVAVAALLL